MEIDFYQEMAPEHRLQRNSKTLHRSTYKHDKTTKHIFLNHFLMTQNTFFYEKLR